VAFAFSQRLDMNFQLYFFQRSTIHAALRLLFLERFTTFQQGKWRSSTTLTGPRGRAVQTELKINRHFA
jgi:hypothetical protein